MRQCMDADNLHRRLKKIIGQVQAIRCTGITGGRWLFAPPASAPPLERGGGKLRGGEFPWRA